MTSMRDYIKSPKLWLNVCVIYIWLFGLSILIASIGPPYVIARIANDSLSIAGIEKAILFYAQEGANKLGYKYEYILFSLAANVLILIPAIVLCFFILRGKLWALKITTILITAYVVKSVVFGLLIFKSPVDALTLNIVILLLIAYFFMKPRTKALFNAKNI